ncbi:hypothetical protein R6Q57_014802, partial [Mikania cordata]
MSILTTLHHYFDLQRYHNTEYWEDIKQGFQADCPNHYKDRKTKLIKHFEKHGGYDNTERGKTKPPEGLDPDAWVRVIEELFTTPKYQKRPKQTQLIVQNKSMGAMMGHDLMHKDVTLKSKKPTLQNILKVGGRCTTREAQ